MTDDSGRAPPRLDRAEWLSAPATQAVLAALAAAGHPARAVGGAVRNALMGLPVSDIDIATPATPAEVTTAAERAGLKVVPTGIEHGTVMVLSKGVPFEVTTLRRDVATDGRHAVVAFTDDWTADARRRDFTINALYCDAAGAVYDPLGGYGDVVARRVRFIGDPGERIHEDFLRILRFFRFHAVYGAGAPDRAGLEACVRERDGLARLSAERVRVEVLKLLAAPGAVAAVEAMRDFGLLVPVIGGMPWTGRLARFAAIEAALGQPATAVLRLAALAVETAEDAGRVAERLKLSNQERAVLERWAPVPAGLFPALEEATARRVLYRTGAGAWTITVLRAWCRSHDGAGDATWRHLLELPLRWPVPRLPVGGADVLALGVASGPQVGAHLHALEDWWIAAGFPLDAQAVKLKLAELVRSG